MNRALVFFSFPVNFFLLNLVLSLLFFLVALMLRHTCFCRSRRSRSSLFLHTLALPPLLSSVILLASFIPPFFILEDHIPGFHLHLGHPYHHLCIFDSTIGLPHSLPFRILLGSSLLLVSFSLLRGLYTGWKTRDYLRWLTRRRGIRPDEEVAVKVEPWVSKVAEKKNLKIQWIQTRFPISFLAGVFHPQVILSTGLLRALSPEQVRALLQHEIAHHLRLDNLVQLLLSFCRNLLFISPTGHLLFRWWREEVELLSDEIAIYSTGRPLDLAEALLKVQKEMMDPQSFRIPPILQSAFSRLASVTFIERRLRNILSFCDQSLSRPSPSSLRLNPLWGLGTFAAVSFVLLCLLDMWIHPLFLHCQLEKIIRLLV